MPFKERVTDGCMHKDFNTIVTILIYGNIKAWLCVIIYRTLLLINRTAYSATGELSVRVTGEPLSVTHWIGGSEPTTSEVTEPPDAVEEPEGMVTGILAEQVLPSAVTVMDLIDRPSSEKV